MLPRETFTNLAAHACWTALRMPARRYGGVQREANPLHLAVGWFCKLQKHTSFWDCSNMFILFKVPLGNKSEWENAKNVLPARTTPSCAHDLKKATWLTEGAENCCRRWVLHLTGCGHFQHSNNSSPHVCVDLLCFIFSKIIPISIYKANIFTTTYLQLTQESPENCGTYFSWSLSPQDQILHFIFSFTPT